MIEVTKSPAQGESNNQNPTPYRPFHGHPRGDTTLGTTLVRMLYNEKETAFKAGCRPVDKGSKFYALDELERCFARTS